MIRFYPGVSEVELFESAVHLFAGPALKWYMTMRTTGRLLNWQHLVLELKRTFMHPDLDALIKMKIYQRRQQRSESFHEFYYEMEKLLRSMCVQIPEYEKVQILLQNIRIDYKKQLTFLPITDLPSLIAAGQKIDALNFSAYNKVFGIKKTVNAVSQGKSKPNSAEVNVNQNRQPPSQTLPNPRTNHPNKTNRQNYQNSPKNQTQAPTHNTAEHVFVSSIKIPLFTQLRVVESIAVYRNIIARLVFEILVVENAKIDYFSQLACKFANL